jgi:hypothetical protein
LYHSSTIFTDQTLEFVVLRNNVYGWENQFEV